MRHLRILAAAGLGLAVALLTITWTRPGAASVRAASGMQARYVATTGRDELAGGAPSACTDPSDPCRTVQHAVDVAAAGDEVRVAAGVYTDVRSRQGQEQALFISRTVAVRGGYGADFAVRDPTLLSATLDAGEQGRVVWISGTGQTTDVRLEALRLRNGSTSDEDVGAGVYVVGARATISGCDIVSNTAGGAGGGIFLEDAHGSEVLSCLVADSSGIWDGCGSICVIDSDDVRLQGLRVGGGQGTGIYVQGGASVAVSHCAVFDGFASQFAAIGFTQTQGAVVAYNEVYSNTALDASGITALECDGVLVLGNQVHGNQSSVGSGMHLGWCKGARVVNNMVWGNSVFDYPGAVGGPGILVYSRDSTSGEGGFDAVLVHNTILGNTGGGGEGVYVALDVPSIVSMTNNIVVSQSVGVHVTEGNTVMLEATLWGAGEWANGEDWSGDGTVVTGTGSIWALPGFVDPIGNDYHIGGRSAAVNEGVSAGVADDIDRDPRPIGAAPDIGADERRLTAHLPILLKGWP